MKMREPGSSLGQLFLFALAAFVLPMLILTLALIGAFAVALAAEVGWTRGYVLAWSLGLLGAAVGIEVCLVRTLMVTARREANHMCLRCGYDLSGCAGGICPECGDTFLDRPNQSRGDSRRGDR